MNIFKTLFKITFVFLILLSPAAILKAQVLKIDGADTTKVSKLISQGKKFKLESNGKELLKVGLELEEVGKATDSKVGLLYASLYKAHANWLFSNYTEDLKYSLEALDRSKKWNIKNKLPDIYNSIGTDYKENLDYPKALDAAAKAMQAARDLNDTAALIVCYRVTGMFMHGYAYNLGFETKGKPVLKKSLEMDLFGLNMARSNPKYEINSIGFYNNIADIYRQAKNYKTSIQYSSKALELATKYKQYKSATYAYAWLGGAYFAQGDRPKGFAYVQTAIDLCKKYKFIFREMELYSGLEDMYVQSGDYKNAWKAKTRWVNISDSLNIIKNVQHLSDLDVKYQTVEKNAQIKLLDENARHKNLLFLLAGAGFVIVLIFTFELYHQKRQINRSNESLTESNKTIKDQAIKLETLLKELHHRVKNNLQIVTSLLNLQSNRLTDADAIHAIRDSQQRIEAMSLIHRTLYQQQDSSMVNMRQYISDLVMSVMKVFGVDSSQTDLNLTIDVEEMDIDIALPLGLIINELVINSFKHVFTKEGKKLVLTIDLKCSKDCHLIVQDNGPGMPIEVWKNPQNSFGIKLVKLLTKQLGGTCTMNNSNGAKFELHIASKLKI